ncbi:MAG: DNA-primase RepB domain-containing protein [Lautropia sp.]
MILTKSTVCIAGTGSVSDIELDQTRRFLHCLAQGEPVTFQTYWDPKSEKEPSGTSHARVLHGMLDQQAARLGKLNAARAGIFVAVNTTDGAGRKAENIIAVRALALDLDGAPIEPVLAAAVTPDIVVESSSGRWHVYWKVSDCPLDRLSGLQRAPAARFGGDPLVIDLPRVLRLPGFVHRKGEPVRTELRECRPDMPPYPVDVLVERLGLDEHAQRRARTRGAATSGDDRDLVPEALTEDQCADLEDALFSLNADDRGRWVNMSHALRTTDDDDRARDLWLRWSATSTAFDPDNDPDRWEGFRPTRTGWRAVLEAQ